MKEEIKKIIFGYLPGFITGLIICGTISVIAATYFPSNDVTYDNTESGLKSTNVQGAIDELYGVCFPSQVDFGGVEVPVVDESDGLYEDEYEDGRYFYKGGNPNNYITFNNEQAGWRIISIEPDGTIKIMRTDSIENQAWDTSGSYGSNNWARPAYLNTYLNETYYNGLNATAKSQIVAKDWSIGGVTWDNNNLNTQIKNENATKWNGKVALVTVSEYLRSNSNKNSCGSLSLNNANYSSCVNTGWMYTTAVSWWWTLSPRSGTSDYVFYVTNYGTVSESRADTPLVAVRPAVYLSSEVTLTGSGTQSDPYEISL